MENLGRWQRLRRRVQAMVLGFLGIIPNENSSVDDLSVDENSGCKLLKIIVVGNKGIGKTSLAYRFAHGTYKANIIATIGLDFWQRVVNLEDEAVKVQVWDSAGHDHPTSFPPKFLRAKQAVIIAYDKTDRASFEKVTEWIEVVRKAIDRPTKIVIVGTKRDAENVAVTTGELREFAQMENVNAMETSAKDGYGVDELFIGIVKMVLKKRRSREQFEQTANSTTGDSVIVLHEEVSQSRIRSCGGRRRSRSVTNGQVEEFLPLLSPETRPSNYESSSNREADPAVASISPVTNIN